jgi:hypothetical protein
VDSIRARLRKHSEDSPLLVGTNCGADR